MATPPAFPYSISDVLELISATENALSKVKASINDPLKAFSYMAEVTAASGALEATILPPFQLIMNTTLAFELSGALGSVIHLGIPEILGAAGEGGLSSKEVEKICGLPYGKVSRQLRILAGQGIFEELRPDVWTHSRVSKLLDTGRPYEEIAKEHPSERFSKAPGIVAFASFVTEVGPPMAAAKLTAFHDNKYKKSYKPTEAPFAVAFNTDRPFWEWLQTTDDGLKMKHFARLMTLANDDNEAHDMYPWQLLGENATLVDVGGGIGSASASILNRAPNITKIFTQDRPEVIETALKFWEEHNSELLASRTVEFQPHDFFTAQPIKGASVYLFRQILHDWPDEDVAIILKQLADAASNTSRLLIQEGMIEYSCHDISEIASNGVEGAYAIRFDKPLPANGGRAFEWQYMMDMHIMEAMNGQERTFEQFRQLAVTAGWKPVKVHNARLQKFSEWVKA